MPNIKTVILFDQYSVSISMTKATIDTDLQLHEYHLEDWSRTCRKTLCAGCGKELTAEDIVKGFEYEDNCLVLLKKEDFKQIKAGTENHIHILYSTSLEQVLPVYFSNAYFASPEAGSEKIFEIIRLSLVEEQKILIGKALLSGFDSLVALIPTEEGLVISKLYLENEITKAKKPYKKQPVSLGERDPVKSLLQEMYSPFDVSVYENAYQNNLRKLIFSKIDACIDTYNC